MFRPYTRGRLAWSRARDVHLRETRSTAYFGGRARRTISTWKEMTRAPAFAEVGARRCCRRMKSLGRKRSSSGRYLDRCCAARAEAEVFLRACPARRAFSGKHRDAAARRCDAARPRTRAPMITRTNTDPVTATASKNAPTKAPPAAQRKVWGWRRRYWRVTAREGVWQM